MCEEDYCNDDRDREHEFHIMNHARPRAFREEEK